MRRHGLPLSLLLAFALLWQGAAGAIASGRMAALGAMLGPGAGHVICNPGGTSAADPESIAEQALCDLHCGAVTLGATPKPARVASPVVWAQWRPVILPRPLAPLPQLARPPPARAPPSLA